MGNKYSKENLTSFSISRIKTGLRVYVTKPEWLSSRKQVTRNSVRDVGGKHPYTLLIDMYTAVASIEISRWFPQMPKNIVIPPRIKYLGLHLYYVAIREEQK